MTLDFPSLSPSTGQISSRPLLISKVSSIFQQHNTENIMRKPNLTTLYMFSHSCWNHRQPTLRAKRSRSGQRRPVYSHMQPAVCVTHSIYNKPRKLTYTQEHAHSLSPQRNRLHGGSKSRACRNHQNGRPARLRRELLNSSSYLNYLGSLLRCRQLRHVWSSIQTAIHLHLANWSVQCDGT